MFLKSVVYTSLTFQSLEFKLHKRDGKTASNSPKDLPIRVMGMRSLAPGLLLQPVKHGLVPTRHGWKHTHLPCRLGGESLCHGGCLPCHLLSCTHQCWLLWGSGLARHLPSLPPSTWCHQGLPAYSPASGHLVTSRLPGPTSARDYNDAL